MQSGREDTLEERYAIKFCFKLGKNATESYHEKKIRVTDLPGWLKSLQDAILKTRDCEKVDNEAA